MVNCTVRGTRGSAVKSSAHQFANDAVHVLNGARALDPAQAAKTLRDLMSGVKFADTEASVPARTAYRKLIDGLEAEGAASDDDWQQAIETMTTLAGEQA
jgi:hypothetical protein